MHDEIEVPGIAITLFLTNREHLNRSLVDFHLLFQVFSFLIIIDK